jgi:hypothetical protein
LTGESQQAGQRVSWQLQTLAEAAGGGRGRGTGRRGGRSLTEGFTSGAGALGTAQAEPRFTLDQLMQRFTEITEKAQQTLAGGGAISERELNQAFSVSGVMDQFRKLGVSPGQGFNLGLGEVGSRFGGSPTAGQLGIDPGSRQKAIELETFRQMRAQGQDVMSIPGAFPSLFSGADQESRAMAAGIPETPGGGGDLGAGAIPSAYKAAFAESTSALEQFIADVRSKLSEANSQIAADIGTSLKDQIVDQINRERAATVGAGR